MLKKGLFLLVIVFCLQGCVPLLVGGAAATVAIIYIHDQRTSSQKASDKQLQRLIEKKLSTPIFRDDCHIIVSVFNGYVLLAGQAPTKELKLEAERIALTAPGIIRLYNQISIEAPNSTLSRVNDSWLNTRIEMKLLNDPELKTAELQIITSDGTVYLMGDVTPKQAKKIVSLVSSISGVQKIVKVFQLKNK